MARPLTGGHRTLLCWDSNFFVLLADHLCYLAATPRVGHSTVGVRLNGRDCLIIFGGDSSGHGSSELLDDTRLVDFTDISAPCWRDLYPEDGPRPTARTEHTAVATVRTQASDCSPTTVELIAAAYR